MSRETEPVWILNERLGMNCVYHRWGRRGRSRCNLILNPGKQIMLGNARKFARACTRCWSADERPRPIPLSTNILWGFSD